MATYVKGDAVANATSYELIEKVNPASGDVTTTKYSNVGYVLATTGALTGASSTWIHSDFIKVSDLADDTDGVCVKTFIGHGTVAAMAFYSAKDDFGSFTEGYILSNTSANATAQSVAQVKANITNDASTYVVFSTDGSKAELQVTAASGGNGEVTYETIATASDINFDVSEIVADGNSHTFVVQAKGDGVNYLDSDYSNEVTYPTT